jgi:translation initiation factor 1
MDKRSKKFNSFEGIVFSTNPNYSIETTDNNDLASLTPKTQHLKVQLDRKQRGGKTITLITGFIGSQSDLETLSKKLKNKFGVGGSAKDGEIIIQGDFKEKTFLFLSDEGYKVKKVGG